MSAPFKASEDYDASALLRLIQVVFQEQSGRIDPPSSMNRLKVSDVEAQLATEAVFVIERKSAPIACLFGTRKSETLYISKLSVHPDARGAGYATSLISAAETKARSLGLQHLELISRRELTEVHAMFRHLGFEKFAEGSHSGYEVTTEFHFRKNLR